MINLISIDLSLNLADTSIIFSELPFYLNNKMKILFLSFFLVKNIVFYFLKLLESLLIYYTFHPNQFLSNLLSSITGALFAQINNMWMEVVLSVIKSCKRWNVKKKTEWLFECKYFICKNMYILYIKNSKIYSDGKLF